MACSRGGRPEDVRSAQDQLVAAQSRLQSLQNQGRSESVGQAQANLTSAQAKLDALLKGPTNDQVTGCAERGRE